MWLLSTRSLGTYTRIELISPNKTQSKNPKIANHPKALQQLKYSINIARLKSNVFHLSENYNSIVNKIQKLLIRQDAFLPVQN